MAENTTKRACEMDVIRCHFWLELTLYTAHELQASASIATACCWARRAEMRGVRVRTVLRMLSAVDNTRAW
jgi:hypothetical protein